MAQLAGHVKPSAVTAVNVAISASDLIPPLESGDRLARPEFERRYKAAPDIRAELVEGVVYVSSPVSLAGHGLPHMFLVTLTGTYFAASAGVVAADNTTVRLDADNEPQPDVLMMRASTGSAKIDSDDYVAGPPELVAEIAASSASYDLHDKLNAYRRAGVKEYVIWRTLDGEIDYFILRSGKYEPIATDSDGTIRSEAFPGFWLNVKALLAGDLASALQTMQAGIASPEHAAFAASLTAAP